MQRVVVIPSRYGSTRFEGKPLFPILGRPMIQWVYEAACQARGVDRVAVATDDRRIAEAVASFGGTAVMTARENRSGTDRAAEAAGILGLAPDDRVVNIQGDQPAFTPRHIEEVLRPFDTETGVEMSTLAFKIVNPDEITNPKDCKVTFDRDGYALYFSRASIPWARDADTLFDTFKHLGIYAYTKRFLDTFRQLPDGRLEVIEKLEQLRALEHGYRIKVVVTTHDSPEVDLPEDIPRIETILKRR